MANPPPKSLIFIKFSRPQNGAALPSPGQFSQSKGSIGSNRCKSDSCYVQGGQKSQQGHRGHGHCLGRARGIQSPDFFPPPGGLASAASCSLTSRWSTLSPSLQQGFLLSCQGWCGSCTSRRIWPPLQHFFLSASKHKKRGARSGVWWAERIKYTATPIAPPRVTRLWNRSPGVWASKLWRVPQKASM